MVNRGQRGRWLSKALVVSLFSAAVALVGRSVDAGEINTGYFGNVAIKGYDPVAYFTMRKAVKGSDEHAQDWLGAEWHFANAEHRNLFASNPVKYAPQYGGHCADGIAYQEKTANIDPEAWNIIDGKLYLNFAPVAAEEFEAEPEVQNRAESNWPDIRGALIAQ